ncbi:MAG: flavin reductase family protein [Lentisphaerae bacterium]|nr:flavin reductase family protein [Lentisphaerota bacterium]MCP4102658.1 flavin reductase family protein [Lentisphaerota bacterium]
MKRNNIDIDDFNVEIFKLLNKGWMLLNGGDYHNNEYNPMTISWGMMGTMWFKPVVMVGVRPQRHTLKLIEKYDSFTLNALSEDQKDILSFCGAHSGSEVNKVVECGLTPIKSEAVDCAGFDEAELIIECRKLYYDQLKGKNFLDKGIIPQCYPNRDFHLLFVAEVLNISGAEDYM